MMDSDAGRQVRQLLFGPSADETLAAGAAAELAPELNRLADEFVFGQVWQDQRLEVKYRSLVTIAALVVLGREQQLRAHVIGGVRAGLSRAEIVAAIVHLAWYAGLPAAYASLEVVRGAFRDLDAGHVASGREHEHDG
jgi:4-carboxymuconolactone decarboxylase